MRTISVFATALLLACAGSNRATPEPIAQPPIAPVETAPPTPDAIALAVAHSERTAADKKRDRDRKPYEVLTFFGVEPGDRVVEIAGASGYYTELLARVVGSEGEVYAQNNRFLLGFALEPLVERLDRIKLSQIKRLDTELDSPELPSGVDSVLMVLFYHDTVWLELDRPAFLANVMSALEPGGVFGVIDHHAEVGSGLRDVKSIHRIDVEALKKEVLAAGFVADGESDALSHSEDDRTKNVFDKTIRGKTDRFILRFRKPAR